MDKKSADPIPSAVVLTIRYCKWGLNMLPMGRFPHGPTVTWLWVMFCTPCHHKVGFLHRSMPKQKTTISDLPAARALRLCCQL